MIYWTKVQDFFLWQFGLRKRYNLEDVYTSGSPAEINYVRRPELENLFISNLKVKGKQIAVFGHSGGGKTTLVQKLLKEEGVDYIYTPCSVDSTFDELLLSAFDELNPYYIDSTSVTKSSKRTVALQAEYNGIKTSISAENTGSTTAHLTRALPLQLNAKKLSDFLGDTRCCWIIEDFHKLGSSDRQKLADCLKVFVDQGSKYPKTKVICIGVVGSVHDLLTFDTNLNTRVAEIEVPLLSDEENRQLITNGCRLLNIQMDKKMIEDIISYSNRIGSVAHQMCFDICYKNHIQGTCKHSILLEYEKFADALQSYIEGQSDRLHFLYEGAVRADVGWYILRTLANTGWDKVTIDAILKTVNQNHKHKQFTRTQVIEKLRELSLPEIGIVKYDDNADKYSLSSPFWGAFIKMQQRLEFNKSQKKKKPLMIENQQGIEAILHNMILQELNRIQNM